MDQPLKSAGQSALDAAFDSAFARSRAEPPATLDQRCDRLARLRSAVADNEARFRDAISADFGNRSVTETAVSRSSSASFICGLPSVRIWLGRLKSAITQPKALERKRPAQRQHNKAGDGI